MTSNAAAGDLDVPVHRYEHDDGVEIVADFGATTDADVDVVDGTAIVVVDRDGAPVEREFDVPSEGSAQAFINNGVVTIEVER